MSSKKRSKLEEQVGAVLEPRGFQYEPCKLAYTVEKLYTPDFCYGPLSVEVKGWFRPGDRQKYKAIDRALRGRGETFCFIFQDPNKKCSKGAKITMAEWADKEDIAWFACAEDLLGWWDAVY